MILRFLRWPLKYRSTIVVPIRPPHNKPNDPIVGFFCVDSRTTGAFNVETDLPLIQCVSDNLYGLIKKLSESEPTLTKLT